MIETWCEILHRVPGARLVLKTHQFSDADHGRTDACGEFVRAWDRAARVTLRGASHHRAFVAEYNGIDFVLDPFPYCGGLTTCEALWMGVPTLTLPGRDLRLASLDEPHEQRRPGRLGRA